MTLVVRRRVPNPSAVVLSYHCTVRDALEGTAIASVEQTPAPVSELPSVLSHARELVGAAPGTPVAVIGYSRGCQAVRSLLMAGAPVTAWVTIDGTHDSWPHLTPRRVEAWRSLAERARAGETLWIATCTIQTYTEHLRRSPFASSVTVLEAATGLSLRRDGGPPLRVVAGGLIVEAHPSATIDVHAHARQAREVLPRLVRDDLVPRLERPSGTHVPSVGGPSVLREPREWWPDGWQQLPLGLRSLVWLGFQSGLNPREIPGARHDPRILEYSRHCRRGGRLLGVVDAVGLPLWEGGTPLPLGADEDPWCAALASESLRRSLLPGERPPHGLRVSVRELVEDARREDTWRPVEWTPAPGALAIEARGSGDPTRGGPGHVRAVVGIEEGPRYLGIGGNEQDRIQVVRWPLARAELRGWIER